MGLRVFTAKQIQAAWGLSRDSQATQAFDPWAEKTARLAAEFPAQFLALVATLMHEHESREILPSERELSSGLNRTQTDHSRFT